MEKEQVEKIKHDSTKVFSYRINSEIKEVYAPEDISDIDYIQDVGKPGEYPFTRGIHPHMYRERPWIMRELTGYGTSEDTRKRAQLLDKLGSSGLNIICDHPTYEGIDPDHPLAKGAVGKGGVPLPTLIDMEDMLEDVPLDNINSSLVISTAPSIVILAQYLAVAEKRGIPREKLRGTIQNEPILGRYRGHLPSCRHLDLCLNLASDVIEYCAMYLPSWTPNNTNPAIQQRYGIDTGLELAICFSVLLVYLDEAKRRGLDVSQVARKLAVMTETDINFFEEACKFRAMRRLWARLLRERFGITEDKDLRLRIGNEAGGLALYPQDILNNIPRLTLITLASVLGGVQSIFVPGYDEPVSLPSEEAHKLSLRIQQIIAHETGVTNVVDPLAGSYYVEWLTNRIEQETRKRMQQIDQAGGILACIESGWLDEKLDKAAIAYYRAILDEQKIVKVGVNLFREAVPTTMKQRFRVPEQASQREIQKVNELKRNRDNEKVVQVLALLWNKTKEKRENLVPYVIEAVKVYATIGEIFGTVQEAYGYPYDSMNVLSSPFKFPLPPTPPHQGTKNYKGLCK
ncbi:MAG: methylmalonyl-CoA mutase family protein [Chloroflexota bacterium]|nr:methylmalonyl-CoA mutase family protein [Chloroflexota bacterium]